MMTSAIGRLSVSGVALLGLLGVWEAVVKLFKVRPVTLPAPSMVLAELSTDLTWYLGHAAYTLTTTLAGFGLSVVVGVLIGMLIVSSRWFESAMYPLIVALNSVPKVAVAPLFVIWLGTGAEPKIAIAFLIAVFAIIVDTVLGMRSTPTDVLDFARITKARQLDVFFKIWMPCALPAIFSGMKVAISLALVGTIVGEFVSAQRGLGYVILSAQGMFDTTRVFAAIVLLAVMGLGLFAIVSYWEKYALPWRDPSQSH